MLSCLLNEQRINCFDGLYTREQLKKWANKKILLCPACGKPYEYCHGKVKTPYFRHMDKEQCEDKYSEAETEEHMNGKRDLYEWIKVQPDVTDVILEGWIPETKQKPDIMFNYNKQKCVIEYQCTPIATEYYERHELYQAAGIQDIWICGTKKFLGKNKRLNVLEKESRLYYNEQNKIFYKLENITEKEIDNIRKIESLRRDFRDANKYYKRKYLNRKFHVMKNVYDYLEGYPNYLYIKNISSSYHCVGSYYPSPTRRPSNKYPYPVREYDYTKNHSYATCYRLCSVKLKNITEGE